MYMHLLLQFIYTKRIQLINKYKTEELLIGNLNLSVSQRTTISTKNNFIIYLKYSNNNKKKIKITEYTTPLLLLVFV